MAEEWCCKTHKMVDAEALSCAEIKKTLGALKQEQYKLIEKFKKAESGSKSAETGLKNAEKQAED